jgi:hypothetical protein
MMFAIRMPLRFRLGFSIRDWFFPNSVSAKATVLLKLRFDGRD